MVVTLDPSGDFILDYKFGFDFCRAVETCSPKNDFVYLSCDGKVFSVFSQARTATVFGQSVLGGGEIFSMGIESSKFVALFKRLYAGSPIRITPTSTHLIIREDNIKVRFPLAAYTKQLGVPDFSYIGLSGESESVAWLAKGISNCDAAVGVSRRFPGVLVDNTSSGICRLVKISETAIRICAHAKIPFRDGSSWGGRAVVSPEMAKTLSRFHEDVTELMITQNVVGLHLSSGVKLYAALFHDDLPMSYTHEFGLLDSTTQIVPVGRKYVFERQRFLDVLELVSAVVGAEESLLLCEIHGLSESSGFPVWKISARTHNGCEASEFIESAAPGSTDMEPFRIHKNRAISSLKLHGDTLLLYDNSETFLLVTNEDCSDVTLLVKAPV